MKKKILFITGLIFVSPVIFLFLLLALFALLLLLGMIVFLVICLFSLDPIGTYSLLSDKIVDFTMLPWFDLSGKILIWLLRIGIPGGILSIPLFCLVYSKREGN